MRPDLSRKFFNLPMKILSKTLSLFQKSSFSDTETHKAISKMESKLKYIYLRFHNSKPAVNRQPGDRRGTDEAAFSFSNTNFYSIKFFKKNMSSKYLNIWKFILYFIKIMFYSLIMLQTTKNNITWWNYVPKSIYFWQTRVRKKNLKMMRCKNASRALIEALSQLFLHLRPDLSRKFLFLLSKNPDLP